MGWNDPAAGYRLSELRDTGLYGGALASGEETMGNFLEKYVVPIILPLVLFAIIVAALVGIGEMLTALYRPGDTPDRLDRPELWTAVGILLGVIAIVGFLSTRPKGALGPLEKDVVIGSRPIGSDELPRVDSTRLRGEPGTVSDVTAGYTLYAQSGALARVLGILPGGTDYGKRFSGFLYAEGLGRNTRELWIPFEAVTAVYPETQSAFLAIKGDETEAFGWHTPPESIVRGAPRPHTPADRVK